MIHLDCTKFTVVIVCTLCPHWHALRFTKLEGWECAAAHEKRAHPGAGQAQRSYSKALARARHAG